jgi:hypothetical protein
VVKDLGEGNDNNGGGERGANAAPDSAWYAPRIPRATRRRPELAR